MWDGCRSSEPRCGIPSITNLGTVKEAGTFDASAKIVEPTSGTVSTNGEPVVFGAVQRGILEIERRVEVDGRQVGLDALLKPMDR